MGITHLLYSLKGNKSREKQRRKWNSCKEFKEVANVGA